MTCCLDDDVGMTKSVSLFGVLGIAWSTALGVVSTAGTRRSYSMVIAAHSVVVALVVLLVLALVPLVASTSGAF